MRQREGKGKAKGKSKKANVREKPIFLIKDGFSLPFTFYLFTFAFPQAVLTCQ